MILNITKVYHMEKLVSLENKMVAQLKEHSQLMEAALKDIEKYVVEVADVYKDCGDEGCSEDITEQILGNPIENFQLLKRVTVTWKKVLSSIENIDGKKIVSNLKKIKKKEKIPNDGDLNFAAKSINYLQEVYQFSPKDLTGGSFVGTKSKLTEQDLFYLASTAAKQGKHGTAVDLLEHAIDQYSNQNKTLENDNNLNKMENLLHSQKRKIAPVKELKHILGRVPAKTNDYSKMTTDLDKFNYQALCRGENVLPGDVSKTLQCFYSTR